MLAVAIIMMLYVRGPAVDALFETVHDTTREKSFVYNAEDLPQSQIIRASMFVGLTDSSRWSGSVCLITRSLKTNKITVRHDLRGSAFCSPGSHISNHIFGQTRIGYCDAILIVITWRHLAYCLRIQRENKFSKNKKKKKGCLSASCSACRLRR